RTVLLKPSEIDCIEAVGNYSKIHRGAEGIVVRQTLAALEERLREHGFIRIQRSIIVNLERIAEIRRDGRESYSVVLSSGARFRLGERYRANLDAMLVRL
ncbi:MAG TPA: LytTR family DNA-binding domain-containing protein, partial [Thermoanaerobaculia bacterium]|nr:LytTR family DNA-binding domain-containing protein [Thermoanaerobaculia bacterium]